MKTTSSIYAALFALLALSATTMATKPRPSNAVLLSNVKSLTLKAGKQTSHRRVSAIPQLKCIGGSAKGKYEVDIMRCTNAGSSYDDADVEWSCTASLPPEFKLGSTDVICEGYSGPDDSYVLKGSCGVEYRLVLTEAGEEKYGKGWFGGGGERLGEKLGGQTTTDKLVTSLFWLLFCGVLLWMLYSYFVQRGARRQGAANPRPPRWGGGGGGGGGFWPGGGDDDPPPPYDYQPPRSKPSYPRSSSQGWRPGFWSGAGAGAAAGYAAGRAAGDRNNGTSSWGRGGSMWDRGEGSSGGSSAPSNFSAPSSARYSSTGFGSTSRR